MLPFSPFKNQDLYIFKLQFLSLHKETVRRLILEIVYSKAAELKQLFAFFQRHNLADYIQLQFTRSSSRDNIYHHSYLLLMWFQVSSCRVMNPGGDSPFIFTTNLPRHVEKPRHCLYPMTWVLMKLIPESELFQTKPLYSLFEIFNCSWTRQSCLCYNHRLKMWRRLFSGVCKLRDDFKPQFVLQQ